MRSQLVIAAIVVGGLWTPNLPARPPGALPDRAQRVSFTLHYTIVPQGPNSRVELVSLVPKTLPDRQKILKVKYSPRPDRVYEENGALFARFVIDRPTRPVEIRIDGEVELYRYDLAIASTRKKTGKPPSPFDLRKWLAAEKFIEKDAAEVQKAARQITGKGDLETVGNIMRFVGQTLRYSGFDEKDLGAVGALKAGHGDCSEYTDLFVALCRAKGIPARVWEGYLTPEIPAGDTPRHSRAEVYLADFGWVPIDPLHTAHGGMPLDHLPPIYIYLSSVRNNPALRGYHYVSYRYTGQPVAVRSEFIVHKREDLSPASAAP